MFCPNCGATNTEGVRFCKGCGAPIASAPQATPVTLINPVSAYAPSPLVQKKENNFQASILMGIAAILFALPFFLAIFEIFFQGAAENAKTNLDALEVRHGLAVYSGIIAISGIAGNFIAAGLSLGYSIISFMRKKPGLALIAIAFTMICLMFAIMFCTTVGNSFKQAEYYQNQIDSVSNHSTSSNYNSYSDIISSIY